MQSVKWSKDKKLKSTCYSLLSVLTKIVNSNTKEGIKWMVCGETVLVTSR